MNSNQTQSDKPDKLLFYSKSRKVAPGKGVHETVQNLDDYTALWEQFPDFRKMLSNFDCSVDFKYEGHMYRSIEHVFQAKKIAIVDEHKAFWFTIDSKHDIGIGDGQIAQKNRKLVKLAAEDLAKWGNMKDEVMYDAAIAKYNTCNEARVMLISTNNSELWHIVARSVPTRFVHLEKIREKIRQTL